MYFCGTLPWLQEKLSHCLNIFRRSCYSRWSRTWGFVGWNRAHKQFNPFRNWMAIRNVVVSTETEYYCLFSLGEDSRLSLLKNIFTTSARGALNQGKSCTEYWVIRAEQQNPEYSPSSTTTWAMCLYSPTLCCAHPVYNNNERFHSRKYRKTFQHNLHKLCMLILLSLLLHWIKNIVSYFVYPCNFFQPLQSRVKMMIDMKKSSWWVSLGHSQLLNDVFQG